MADENRKRRRRGRRELRRRSWGRGVSLFLAKSILLLGMY